MFILNKYSLKDFKTRKTYNRNIEIIVLFAGKHKKFKHLEKIEQATFQPGANQTRTRDVVRHT